MRLAIVMPSASIGGAEKRAFNIYRRLRSSNVELWVSAQMKRKLRDIAPDIAEDAVVYFNRMSPGRFARAAARKLYAACRKSPFAPLASAVERMISAPFNRHINKMVRDRNIDLIHVFMDADIYGPLQCASVHELVGPVLTDRLAHWSERRKAAYTAYNAVSDSVFKRAQNYVSPERLTMAPIAFFNPPPRTFVLDGKSNTILFAHRMVERKNAPLFARAAKIFLAQAPDWTIKILGFGPERGDVEAILKDEIGAGRACIDCRADIWDDMADSRIFVSVNALDNYPSQSVLEAMYAGNALVLSDTGSTRERFLDGNGILTSLTPQAISDTLLSLIADEAGLRQMGERSQALCAERYHADRYLEWLGGMYSSITAQSGATS